ncbi:MAG: hypothetical protein HY905_08355 [Deltaproteobacteria bacterium]|nr:hypothetical protein [Deltaproteobacteria bacterium]
MKGRTLAVWAIPLFVWIAAAFAAPGCGGGGGGGGDDVDADAAGDMVGDEPIDDDAAGEDGREDGRDDGREDGVEGDGTDGDGADADEGGGADGDADVTPICGDTVVDPGEDCDDGNTIPGDGCEDDCTFSCVDSTECDDLEPCNGVESCTGHMCVDGTPPAEGSACTLPSGDAGACRGGLCASADCGNAVVDTGEECDDGNADNTDACLTSCMNATCGDAYVHTGVEECDDGNAVAGDGCEDTCTYTCHVVGDCDDAEFCNGGEVCGAGHYCESGTPPAEGTACTLASGGAGACRSGLCAAAACGNALVDPGEECDDGNADNTDACLTSCVNATCGDTYIHAGVEDCDSDPARTCTTTCGSTGSQACDGTCHWETACTPPAEVCNGLDDDCVGGIDNGFTCVPAGTQACTTTCSSTGSQTCSSACAWGTCTAPVEVCNGADDDCVGGADNGFACVRGATGSCTTSCGSTGSQLCDATCVWGSCTPPAEVCNGADDDCTGGADNGFTCVRAATRGCHTSCDPAGTDTGTQTCDATCVWGSCAAPAETCDGRDNDCDGACDDGFGCCRGAATTCTTTCGSTGVGTCTATCALPTGAACTPPIETCNGRDDDCDTVTDDGFTCAAGATRACTVGTCAGTQTCDAACSAWGACTVPTPVNDTCAGAITLTPPRDATGTTCNAAADYTPTCGGASTAGRDVVYRLDITSPSNVVLETDTGTPGWDALLHLHSGATCPGAEVACNDDIAPGDLDARITTTLVPGTYWVVVDGFNAASYGAFTLRTTVTPAGDECIDPIPLTLTAARTTITGTTATATASTGSCAAANDLWFSFTLTQTERVFVNTYGSAFDTQLALLNGCGMVVPVCVDDSCAGDQSEIVRTLPAGDYIILLDGFGTASGNYTLNLEHLPLAQDGTARALAAGASTLTDNTTQAGPGVVTGSCGGASTSSEHSYFWTTCPAGTAGTFTASTCMVGTGYDTVVYLRSGATGVDIACNDDGASPGCGGIGSELSGAIPAGAGLFGFYMDGWGGAEGAYRAAVNRP